MNHLEPSHDSVKNIKPNGETDFSLIEPKVERSGSEIKLNDEPHLEAAPEIGDQKSVESSRTLPSWKLITILINLCLVLMLSSLETSIVATALVNISSSLGDYESSNWIVVSYLLTYTGFMIIYARLSDVFGRKPMLLIAIGAFVLFSLGCGLVSNMKSLIILRSFQGLGASGMYSMVFAVMPEIVPLEWFGAYSGLIGAVYALSSILGPILGGVISNNSTSRWRWVFLLNVPCGAVLFFVLLLLYPKPPKSLSFRLSNLLKIDCIGLLLVLAGSILIIFPLEQAGTVYPWNSGVIIATLTVGVALIFIFVIWEARLSYIFTHPPLPAFPLALLRDRVLAAAYINGFLFGIPFTVTIILLPSRYQVVYGLSPLSAGLRMLPLLLSSAIGSGVGGLFARFRLGPVVAFICGNFLAVLGMGLLVSNSGSTFKKSEYGFLVILGLGFGFALSTLMLIARVNGKPQDSAVIMASLTQIRVLGGCIGLAISKVVVTSVTSGDLSAILTTEQREAVSYSAANIGNLPEPLARQTRDIYALAFHRSWTIMLGITGAAALAGLGVWKKDMKSLEAAKTETMAWVKEREQRS